MGIFTHTCKTAIHLIGRNPGGAVGVMVFGLGFTLIAANALYSQQGQHPSPLWSETRTGSVEKPVREVVKVEQPKTITRSVLTQRISLKNIPVPTANPARTTKVAAQSSLVREVQAVLAKTGFYQGKVDGIYGSATREAIIQFQQRSGIIPNGEASYGLLASLKSVEAVTGSQPKPVSSRTGQATSSQPQLMVFDAATVTKIQSGLKEKFGDEEISVDGVLGNQTRSAIRRFQERFSLDTNGELDDETIQKLLSVGILSSI